MCNVMYLLRKGSSRRLGCDEEKGILGLMQGLQEHENLSQCLHAVHNVRLDGRIAEMNSWYKSVGGRAVSNLSSLPGSRTGMLRWWRYVSRE